MAYLQCVSVMNHILTLPTSLASRSSSIEKNPQANHLIIHPTKRYNNPSLKLPSLAISPSISSAPLEGTYLTIGPPDFLAETERPT